MFSRRRKAFSMLTAIVVIVLMATVAILVMNLSGKMIKETTSQFQNEQASLLAKSYTEYAVMAVMANDRNGTNTCLHTINSDDVIRSENREGFEVRVHIAYISNGTEEVGKCPASTVLSNTVKTINSPLNIIVDVYVRYKDLDSTNTHLITYHKRTLQKI